MSLAKHGELFFILAVIVSVHSPCWRVFEKNGFPHCLLYFIVFFFVVFSFVYNLYVYWVIVE